MRKLEEKSQAGHVEDRALAENNNLQAGETYKRKIEKHNLVNGISEQGHGNEPDRKRLKQTDIYGGFSRQYLNVTSKMLWTFLAMCGRETAELCAFAADEKRRCAYRGGKASRKDVSVSSGSLISSFLLSLLRLRKVLLAVVFLGCGIFEVVSFAGE